MNVSAAVKTQSSLPPDNFSAVRPWLLCGLAVLMVARPLFPSEAAADSGDGLTAVMFWLVLGIFWVFTALTQRSFALRFGVVDVAVAGLIIWHTIAALWAVRTGSPRPAINMLWEWMAMGAAFFLARQTINSLREARALVVVMLALASALAVYGLYQYAYEMPRARAAYEVDPDLALRKAGLWYPPDSPERKLFQDRLYSTEPIATFALTNSLAGVLAPWLVVLLGIICGGKQSRLSALGPIICALVIAVCLLLTKSRSAWLATLVGLALLWPIVAPHAGPRLNIRALLAAIVLFAVLIGVAARFGGLDRLVLTQAAKSLAFRLQYWQASLKIIAEHPWLGCGPGNFREAYTQYKLPAASEEVADPHNFLIEVWATAGTPAAVALVAAVLGFFWCAWKNRSRNEPEADGIASAGLSSRTFPQRLRGAFEGGCGYILGGGLVGFVFSLPLGAFSAAPPSLAAVGLGLPVAALVVALFLGWIENGRWVQLLPALAVLVMLLHLSAAGGIGFPGVAGSFWLLSALGLYEPKAHRCRRWVAWLGLALGIALVIACYMSAYRPVHACWTELHLAEKWTNQAEKHLEAATAADPLAAEPWRRLADVRFERFLLRPEKGALSLWQEAEAMIARLAPKSASDRIAVARRYMQAVKRQMFGDEQLRSRLLTTAVESFRQAIRLYPNNAIYHAELAEAYFLLGDREGFCREAELALRLHHITPHEDKKLPSAIHRFLEQRLHELRDNRPDLRGEEQEKLLQ